MSGVTSFDLAQGVIRYYATPATGALYLLPEVLDANVGVIALGDLDNDTLFDAGVEPAVTLNANVTVPATAVNGNFPSRRLLAGTVTNGSGWTLMAVDQNNVDPAGNDWGIGTQVLGATGAFTLTGLPTVYRLVAFLDTNRNGVPDNGETEMLLSQPDVDATVANVSGLSYVIPPATQGTLAGTIVDSQGNPVPFAQIVVANNSAFDVAPLQASADSLGNYTILRYR